MHDKRSALERDIRNSSGRATPSPILVEESVIENAKTVDFTAEPGDNARLQKWLESLDPEELGKYKM